MDLVVVVGWLVRRLCSNYSSSIIKEGMGSDMEMGMVMVMSRLRRLDIPGLVPVEEVGGIVHGRNQDQDIIIIDVMNFLDRMNG